jgi:WD40 repeat protein
VAAFVLSLLASDTSLIAQPVPRADQPGTVPRRSTDPEAEPQARIDSHGDPLPDGAVFRLGTARFREKAAIAGVAFVPDGKRLVTVRRDGFVRLWDVATGRAVGEVRGPGGPVVSLRISPNGRVVAVRGERSLLLWDVASGRKLRELPCGRPSLAGEDSPRAQMPAPLAFSPNGQTVVWVEPEHVIRLWDVATGQTLRRFGDADRPVRSIAFAAEGKTLLAAGVTGRDEIGVFIWDPAAGRLVREFRLAVPDPRYAGLHFSPDGATLAVDKQEVDVRKVANGTEYRAVYRVRLVNVAAGRERLRFDPHIGYGPAHATAFTPDGRLLAAACGGERIEVWDTRTGKLRPACKGHPAEDGERVVLPLAFAADCKTLASAEGGAVVHLWDIAAGRELREEPEAHQGAVTAITFSPDGRLLASASSDRSVVVWEVVSGRQRHELGGSQTARSVALSPDSKTLAAYWDDRCTLLLCDLHLRPAIIKETIIPVLSDSASVILNVPLVFSPDGKVLTLAAAEQHRGWPVTGGADVTYRVLNVTDRLLNTAKGTADLKRTWKLGAPPTGVVGAPFDTCLALSQDGQTLAYGTPWTVSVIDGPTGREVCQLTDCPGAAVLGFSPDSKTLATGGSDGSVRLWELRTGQEVVRAAGVGPVSALAFAPDGRALAAAVGGHDARIILLETAGGRQVRVFRGHGTSVAALAYAPAGDILASGQADSTILGWRVPSGTSRRGPPVPASPTDVERWWSALRDPSARKAHAALWQLVAVPDLTLPFLKAHLGPIPRANPERLRQLIADLDNDRFAVREQATQELTIQGAAAVSMLRRVLAGSPPEEVRQRVEAVLAAPPTQPDASPKQLRRFRAIQVLELIASDPARKILKQLADGAPGAWETRDAAAALDRLARRYVGPRPGRP